MRVKFNFPDYVSVDDLDTISRLRNASEGRVIQSTFSELSARINDASTIKNLINIANEFPDGTTIEMRVPDYHVELFGTAVEFEALELKYTSVVIRDIEKVKRKCELMDIGDSIEVKMIPGTTNECFERFILKI